MKGTTRVDCQNCATWRNRSAGETPRCTGFTMDGKVWHYAPDMWLAGRAAQLSGHDGVREAMGQWAEMCGLILAANTPDAVEARA